MRWYDLTILRLARCPRTQSPALVRLRQGLPACGARHLRLAATGAFDHSVQDSYSYVVRHLTEVGEQDALKRARAEQRAWITQRNACGTDEACLQKSMETRLQELSAIQ